MNIYILELKVSAFQEIGQDGLPYDELVGCVVTAASSRSARNCARSAATNRFNKNEAWLDFYLDPARSICKKIGVGTGSYARGRARVLFSDLNYG